MIVLVYALKKRKGRLLLGKDVRVDDLEKVLLIEVVDLEGP